MLSINIKEVTSINLNKEAKENAKIIFKELGINMSEAVNIFLAQVNLHKGLPFEVNEGRKATLQALDDAKNKKNMESTSLEEMISEYKTLLC